MTRGSKISYKLTFQTILDPLSMNFLMSTIDDDTESVFKKWKKEIFPENGYVHMQHFFL